MEITVSFVDNEFGKMPIVGSMFENNSELRTSAFCCVEIWALLQLAQGLSP